MAGIELDARTNGLILDEKLMTSVEGIFACGNVVKVHDLVDNVTKQGIAAGGFCADYIIGKRG